MSSEEFERLSTELNRIRQRLTQGFAVDFNDFPYTPKTRNLQDSAGGQSLRRAIEGNLDAIRFRFETFCGFNEAFKRIPALPVAGGELDPHWENWWLPGLDGCILYGLVAMLKPAIYFEVGSGNSTKFVRRSIRDNGLSTKIISIDPHPTAQIDQLCDEVIRCNCEDVALECFDQLGENDILFVDNSHRSFQNSDVTVFFTEILPRLKPGVVYGVHDSFLPWDYPESWNSRFYNEQYLLMSYILGGAGGDEIFLPGHFIYKDPRFSHLVNRLFVGTRHIDWLTGSFWLRRGAEAGSHPGP